MKKQAVAVVAKKELAKVEGNSPADMIRMAVAGNANLDQLEKLLALQERYENNEARKIFASSFAVAQANISAVLKTKSNPQTHSKYADLGDILKSANPVYTKEGFSVIFYEGETAVPESIRVCADVLHRAGHKETYHYDVPLDGEGIRGNANMTKIHGKSSSASYGRRYLMCMIWNIPTQDDNDGNGAGASKPQVSRPGALSDQAVTPKGLPDKIKQDFAKARKLIGEDAFLKIIGNEGYTEVGEITNIAVANQILKDMGTYYENHKG